MSETTMPAAEAVAAPVRSDDDERGRYELAFHVLPTVAEGEVTGVVDTIKAHITNAGGEIFDEETPERFDLAYEIVESIEGKNRKFASAYFGWVRFAAASDAVEGISTEVAAEANILRQMTVRLTRAEEMYPFRFHEALAADKQVGTVEESTATPETAIAADAPKEEVKPAVEETTEVDEKKIDEALKKDEA